MPSRKYILKLCLLGDGAVGKTSLVRRYVNDAFDDKYIVSFGTEVSKKSISVGDAQLDLMIWDILGQKTNESLHAAYYKGATGALAVCDYTRPETMRSLSSWVNGFRGVVGDMPVVILANKSDLDKRFPLDEVVSLASSLKCDVLETSAKTGLNVEVAFGSISRKILEVTA
jgi:small GTP-binding protein